jgi:ABC-type antimicrobial peptide transport system permease subunit
MASASRGGLVALLLAAIELYGVMAQSVRDQRRELGVRMALGATPGRVRRDVLGRAMAVMLLGTSAGLIGVLFSSRLLKSQLSARVARDKDRSDRSVARKLEQMVQEARVSPRSDSRKACRPSVSR